jgi:hypothetical protein
VVDSIAAYPHLVSPGSIPSTTNGAPPDTNTRTTLAREAATMVDSRPDAETLPRQTVGEG